MIVFQPRPQVSANHICVDGPQIWSRAFVWTADFPLELFDGVTFLTLEEELQMEQKFMRRLEEAEVQALGLIACLTWVYSHLPA